VALGTAGEKPCSLSIKGDKLSVVEAVCQLGEWLIKETKTNCPDFIYYEAMLHMGALGEWDPVARRVKSKTNPETMLVLAKMVGVVEFVAYMRKIPAREANVHSIRKDFIGPKCKGPEAKRRCFEMSRLLGWEPSNRDEGDALAVYHFATLRVAPHQAAIITPMMMAKVASTIAGVQIYDPSALFKKAGLRG
jgi:Holliday junction resolvasome RuvABC endonuclease subunit